MKDQFRRQYLLPLPNLAPVDSGFTLIELLVVIIIVGALATIALPNFLKQINRSRVAEATLNVATINRAQSLYYQRNQSFANNLNTLDINVSSKYYQYVIDGQTRTYAGLKTVTRWDDVKAVSGAIVAENGAIKSVVCISDTEVNLGAPAEVPADVLLPALACPSAYRELAN
jgi:prepilin-type N-terminal cleavage/methylation domain-containing protein